MSTNSQKTEVKNIQVRLDKWLWAARFFKTRALARDMVQGGKVQYNGRRVKPSKTVELGAMVKVPQGFDFKEIIILGIEEKRQGSPKAQAMYEETADSQARRETNTEARKAQAFHSPRPENKPDKKQRRKIIEFKHQ